MAEPHVSLADILKSSGQDQVWDLTNANKQEREFERVFSNTFLSWQEIETTLFLIFVSFFPKKRNAALLSAAFHAVISLDARLAMINAVAQMQLAGHKKDLLKTWGVIATKVKKTSKKRNYLAHFSLHRVKNNNGATELRLRPSELDARESGKDYGVAEIQGFASTFRQIEFELAGFLGDIRKLDLPYA